MKDVKGFEGLYAVTEEGRVWSYRSNAFLKYLFSDRGYYFVIFSINQVKTSKTVHRLIAEAYIKNKLKVKQINHKNGIKTDNRIENLEWCTPRENARHALLNGLRVMRLTKEDVLEIRKLYSTGMYTQAHLAELFDVSYVNIHYIVHRKYWSYI